MVTKREQPPTTPSDQPESDAEVIRDLEPTGDDAGSAIRGGLHPPCTWNNESALRGQ